MPDLLPRGCHERVSDSPRKLIRRAHDALQQLEDTLRRYPAAGTDLRAALGDQLTDRVLEAGASVREAHRRLLPAAASDDHRAPKT